MTPENNQASQFLQIQKPHIALITNHGYAGVTIPVGGAPDTGGQNFYVNSLALALSELDYKVSIFARGGFPFFESDKLRDDIEFLNDMVRYVYVPGGGDTFIRKEDIAITLDEQTDWLYDFCNKEATQQGVLPYQLFTFINTHYWDAAVLALQLIQRWQDEYVATYVTGLLEDVLDANKKINAFNEARWKSYRYSPAYHLGRLLVEKADVVVNKNALHAGLAIWEKTTLGKTTDIQTVLTNATEIFNRYLEQSSVSAFLPIALYESLGQAIFNYHSGEYKQCLAQLDQIDKHVWTPHSLGRIKQDNYKHKKDLIRRNMKFCERRNHEYHICSNVKVFASTSTEISEVLYSQYGVPYDSMLYFPPGVDSNIFMEHSSQELQSTYEYLSQHSSLSLEQLQAGTIIFETSRMDKTKRKDLILKAFAHIAENNNNAYLFIGGGPDNQVFADLKKEFHGYPQIKQQAFLLGFIPDEHLAPIFSICDIYVSASEMEGFGMSVAQAAAVGKPLVCSDKIPFATQYVSEFASIVKAGDEIGFAQALQELINEPSKRISLGEKIKQAAKSLDWQVLTRNFVARIQNRFSLN